VLFGNPVHTFAEIKSQNRQVEKPLTARNILKPGEDLTIPNDLMDQVHRKLIVSGSNRSMSGEHTLFSYRLGVAEGDRGSSGVVLPLV
jgi:hypothetical protein